MSVPNHDTACGTIDIGMSMRINIIHQHIIDWSVGIETTTSDIVCEIYICHGEIIIPSYSVDTGTGIWRCASVISDGQILDRYIGDTGIEGDTISGASEACTIQYGCSCTIAIKGK